MPPEKPYEMGKYIRMLAGYQLKSQDGRMLLATDRAGGHEIRGFKCYNTGY